MNLERDGKLITKARARLAPQYHLHCDVVQDFDGLYYGVVMTGGSMNRGADGTYGAVLAVGRSVKAKGVAQRHVFAIAMHYYRMELRIPGYIQREAERAQAASDARFGKAENDLKEVALKVQAIPVYRRSVEQSAFLVKALHLGIIKDCGFHVAESR